MEALQDPRKQRGFKIKNWQPQVIDPATLPDIPSIRQHHRDETFSKHGSKRIIFAGVGAVVGIVIGLAAGNIIFGVLIGLVMAAAGFGITHLVVRSLAEKAAAREIMPEVAKQCGGTWVENAQEIVPPGNPMMDDSRYSGVGSVGGMNGIGGVGGLGAPRGGGGGLRLNVGGVSIGKGGLGIDALGGGFGGSGRVTYDFGDGISGVLPGHDLNYGIFNFTVRTERQSTDSDGERETDVDTDEYIISWLDMNMPVDSLEIKKRMLKGGGALGRMFDRADSKMSSQNVLETESEQFNRAFKIEVADSANEVLVRRMFSPAVLDAFTEGRVQLWDDVLYRRGRIWIVEGDMGHFKVDNVASALDMMLYRSQLVARVCKGLARQVGHDTNQGEHR